MNKPGLQTLRNQNNTDNLGVFDMPRNQEPVIESEDSNTLYNASDEIPFEYGVPNNMLSSNADRSVHQINSHVMYKNSEGKPRQILSNKDPIDNGIFSKNSSNTTITTGGLLVPTETNRNIIQRPREETFVTSADKGKPVVKESWSLTDTLSNVVGTVTDTVGDVASTVATTLFSGVITVVQEWWETVKTIFYVVISVIAVLALLFTIFKLAQQFSTMSLNTKVGQVLKILKKRQE